MRLLFAIFLVGLYNNVVTERKSYSFSISKEEHEQFMNCMQELGYTEETFREAMNNMGKDADEKLKCFRACLYKRSKVLKDDGTIDVDAAIKYHHVENVDFMKNAIIACNGTKGNDDCDTAHSMYLCIAEEVKKSE